MAYVIPVRMKPGAGRGPTVLVIVLTKDNLDRMREGDPFDLQTIAYGDALPLDQRIRDLDIIVAYEEDIGALEKLTQKGDLPGLMKYLERGRRHRPGDAVPPVSLRKDADRANRS